MPEETAADAGAVGTTAVAAPPTEADRESAALEQAGNVMLGMLDDANPTPKEALKKAPDRDPDAPDEDAPEEDPPHEDENAPEPEPEEAPNEDEDSDKALPEEVQAKIDKRIGKEVRKRKAAEEALEAARLEAHELRAAAEARKAEQSAPQTEEEVDLVEQQPEIKELVKAVSRSADIRDEARTYLQRLANDPMSVIEDLEKRGLKIEDRSEQGVRAYLENVIDHYGSQASESRIKLEVRRTLLAGQVQQMQRASDNEALEHYPWLKDNKSPLQQRAAQILGQFKWLKKVPNGLIAIADLVAGEQLRLAKAKAAKPASNGKHAAPPPRLPSSQAPAARTESKVGAVAIAKTKAMEPDSGEEAAVNYFRAAQG